MNKSRTRKDVRLDIADTVNLMKDIRFDCHGYGYEEREDYQQLQDELTGLRAELAELEREEQRSGMVWDEVTPEQDDKIDLAREERD